MTKHYCEVCGEELPTDWGKESAQTYRDDERGRRYGILNLGDAKEPRNEMRFDEVCEQCISDVIDTLERCKATKGEG